MSLGHETDQPRFSGNLPTNNEGEPAWPQEGDTEQFQMPTQVNPSTAHEATPAAPRQQEEEPKESLLDKLRRKKGQVALGATTIVAVGAALAATLAANAKSGTEAPRNPDLSSPPSNSAPQVPGASESAPATSEAQVTLPPDTIFEKGKQFSEEEWLAAHMPKSTLDLYNPDAIKQGLNQTVELTQGLANLNVDPGDPAVAKALADYGTSTTGQGIGAYNRSLLKNLTKDSGITGETPVRNTENKWLKLPEYIRQLNTENAAHDTYTKIVVVPDALGDPTHLPATNGIDGASVAGKMVFETVKVGETASQPDKDQVFDFRLVLTRKPGEANLVPTLDLETPNN